MSSLCWLGKSQSFESILLELGFSKQKLKKSGLSKKERNRMIKEHGEFKLPADLFNHGIIYPTFKGVERPQILGEKGSYLAVHKPSFVHIHPLSYEESDNLLSYLREEGRTSFLQNFSETSVWDGGLLYRLDYETSGLVILSDLLGEYNLSRGGLALKEYYAVVEGRYEGPTGDVCHFLTTSGAKVRVDEDKGSESHLEVEVLKQSEEKSLLKIKLKEGRRHQIRVQLAALGFPIWGDELYGAKKRDQFGLHCYRYQLHNGVEFIDDYFWGTSWT